MCMNINTSRADVMTLVNGVIENYPDFRIDSEFSRDVMTATEVYVTVHIDGSWEIVLVGEFPKEHPYAGMSWETQYSFIWDHCDSKKCELKYVGGGEW